MKTDEQWDNEVLRVQNEIDMFLLNSELIFEHPMVLAQALDNLAMRTEEDAVADV